MVSQEHALLELSFLNLMVGPVSLQSTIDFLFNNDVHIREDLLVSREAVNSIQPLAQKVRFYLGIVSFQKELEL